MIDSILGSPAPVWTGLPPTGFGWMPSTGAARAFGPTASGVGATALTQHPIAGGAEIGTPFSPISTMTAMPAASFGSGSMPGYPGGLFPALGGETTGAVPASALLVTVAVRRGQPQGPTNDADIEEFLYDAFEMLAGAGDVEVRSENGRATLSGSVTQKRLKRDLGEIAWAIPRIADVQNNVTIVSRRRTRSGGREGEPQQGSGGRKQP